MQVEEVKIEKIRSLLTHPNFANILNSLEFLLPEGREFLNMDTINLLRSRLNKILGTENGPNAFDAIIYDQAHACLVELAIHYPLNTDRTQTVVDYAELDPIKKENAVGTSLGHLFDIRDLAGMAKTSRGLFNPETLLNFSQRDKEHIHKRFRKDNLNVVHPRDPGRRRHLFNVLFNVGLYGYCMGLFIHWPIGIAGSILPLGPIIAAAACVAAAVIIPAVYHGIKNCLSFFIKQVSRLSPNRYKKLNPGQARLMNSLTFDLQQNRLASPRSTATIFRPLQANPQPQPPAPISSKVYTTRLPTLHYSPRQSFAPPAPSAPPYEADYELAQSNRRFGRVSSE